MKDILIENQPSLVRDSSSKAIKNLDNDGLKEYKMRKKSIKKLYSIDDRLNNIEDRILNLETTLNNILERLDGSIRK